MALCAGNPSTGEEEAEGSLGSPTSQSNLISEFQANEKLFQNDVDGV